MQIGFIGAGKAGVSLGKYFISKGQKVGGYYSLSRKSAKWAAKFTSTKYYESLQEIISSCDMIFFTVPDDVIVHVWEEAKPFVSGKIIAHCSGLHTSKIFSDIDRTGSSAYSIHPLFAISSKQTSWRQLKKTLFVIEGDEKYISQIQEIFAGMGNRTKIIPEQAKVKYHTAAALASNHMTAIFYMAKKLFLACGFSEKEAEMELLQLAEGNIKNIRMQGCINSLTGPIERNDKSSVLLHLGILDGNMKSIYLETAKILVELAEQKNPDRNYEEMNHILEQL